MKGLLRKEFYNLRFYVLLYYIIDISMIVYFIFGLLESSSEGSSVDFTKPVDIIFSGLVSASIFPILYVLSFSSIIVMVSCEIDEKCNFDKFIISAGVNRREIVNSKFALGFISYFIPFLIMLFFAIFPMFVKGFSSFYDWQMMLSVIFIFIGTIFISVTLNIFATVWLGSTKTKIIGSLFILVVDAISTGAYMLALCCGPQSIINISTFFISVPYLLITTGLLVLFYYLSIKCYYKKQF